MVKVIKKSGKTQAFKASKIVKACKGAGLPEPLAKAIASMIAKEVKSKTEIHSSEIRKMVFDVFEKMEHAKKHWEEYKK